MRNIRKLYISLLISILIFFNISTIFACISCLKENVKNIHAPYIQHPCCKNRHNQHKAHDRPRCECEISAIDVVNINNNAKISCNLEIHNFVPQIINNYYDQISSNKLLDISYFNISYQSPPVFLTNCSFLI